MWDPSAVVQQDIWNEICHTYDKIPIHLRYVWFQLESSPSCSQHKCSTPQFHPIFHFVKKFKKYISIPSKIVCTDVWGTQHTAYSLTCSQTSTNHDHMPLNSPLTTTTHRISEQRNHSIASLLSTLVFRMDIKIYKVMVSAPKNDDCYY